MEHQDRHSDLLQILREVSLGEFDDPDVVAGLRVEFPDSFAVSARTGEGLDAVRAFLWAQSAERAVSKAS